MEIRSMQSSEYLLNKAPLYIDTNSLHPLYDKLLTDKDPKSLILYGPKGVSKTLSIQSYAFQKKIPLISVECSEDTRKSALVGSFVIDNGDTPFVLGDVTNAIEAANECGLAILNFEEINALPPQIQKMLNSITDFRKAVNVPECKKIFRLNDSVRMWVTGTMNNSSIYGGVYSLNEDFRSRFLFKEIGYPSQAEETTILKKLFPAVTASFLEGICVIAKDIRGGNTVGYKLSTRDLVQWVDIFLVLGLKSSIDLIGGKFESKNDRSVFDSRCISRFKELS